MMIAMNGQAQNLQTWILLVFPGKFEWVREQ
jgi:hypothetical protein